MKNKRLLLCFAVWLISMPILFAQSVSDSRPSPSGLNYVRLWTDSIRLQWNPPSVSVTESKSMWKEIPLEHRATYHLTGQTGNEPRNPVSDGKFIYMTSWSSYGPSTFYKYDLYGNYIEQFSVEGVDKSLRDLTYDGEFFYGGFEGINKIVKLDLVNKKLVGQIDVAIPVRHICFIPELDEGRGGFEVGDWNTSSYIDREGNIIKDTALKLDITDDLTTSIGLQVYGTAYHNGKIYVHSQLGEMSVEDNFYYGPYSRLTEFDAETGEPTGRRYSLSRKDTALELEGYMHAAGLEIMEFPQGVFCLMLGFMDVGQNKAPLLLMELDRNPLPDDMIGYNLYADDIKVNEDPLPKKSFYMDLGQVEEGRPINYCLKALYSDGESECSQIEVSLEDSRQLPFIENFNSQSFNTNYWTISDTSAKTPKPWDISLINVGDAGQATMLRYNAGSANLGFSAQLISKRMTAVSNEKVLVRYALAQNVPFSNLPFCDTLIMDVDFGTGWIPVSKDTTIANGSPIVYKTLDLSEMLAGKESFRFRFRVDGNSRTEEHPSGYGYAFFIDDFKVWEPHLSSVSGTVKYLADALEGVDLSFVSVEDVLSYEAKSMEDGSYTLDEIEQGTYIVSSQVDGYNIYWDTLEVKQSEVKYDIVLTRPEFGSSLNELSVTMKPGVKSTSGFTLNNEGNGPMEWNARFSFPVKKSGGSTLSYDVISSWKAQGNVENGFAYLNGHFYAYASMSGVPMLFVYDQNGVLTDSVISLDVPKYTNFKTVISGDGVLYFVKNKDILEYDVESGTFLDTISTDVFINAIAWNNIRKTFYVADYSSIIEIDGDGNELARYDAGGLSVASMAYDPVSESSPVLWLARSYVTPEGASQGEYIGVFQYSLDSAKLTDKFFLANRHPEYTIPDYNNRQSTSVKTLFGSTEIFPGRYTMLVLTSMSAYGGGGSADLCAVYDLAQSVKWVGMKEYKGKLAAGESESYYLDFNSEGLEHGQRMKCTLTFTDPTGVEPLSLPIELIVDSNYESTCYKPTILEHTLFGMDSISLEWKVETPDGALVTDGLKGFNVRRNGMVITDSPVSNSVFVDEFPTMGLNIYEVQALYEYTESSCFSEWSLPDTVYMEYLGDCPAVENLSVEVINQRHLVLDWDSPEFSIDGSVLNESFEDSEPFSLDSIGDNWLSIDRDRALTYGLTDAIFPHNGEALPFIVFNPSETEPSSVERLSAHTGKQMLASFSPRIENTKNDDWLISPVLSSAHSGMVLVFYAKTGFIQYGSEQLNVGYSLSGNQIEDFVFFNGKTPLSVPGEWTRYEYRLPEGTKYVALNCVSKNNFVLLVDDIYVGPARFQMVPVSYSIFKNSEKLTEINARSYGFYDYALNDGTYEYAIEATYSNGCVSSMSEPVSVDIDFQHALTPVRSLTGKVNEENGSIDLSWQEPAWSEPETLRYYTGGIKYGMGLSGQSGEAVPFYAAMKIDMDDYLLMDYSISAVQVGINDPCSVEVFVLDMQSGAVVSSQKAGNINFGSFTTVALDKPVKVEMGKSYLVGYVVSDYENGTFPAGQDDGPLKEGYGDWFSVDGKQWTTVYDYYQGEIVSNWTLETVLEVLANPNDEGTASSKAKASPLVLTNKPSFEVGYERTSLPDEVGYRWIWADNRKASVADLEYVVVKDGDDLNEVPQRELTYSDTEVEKDKRYVYQVRAIYEDGTSVLSDEFAIVYEEGLGNGDPEKSGFTIWGVDGGVNVGYNGNSCYSVYVLNVAGQVVAKTSEVCGSGCFIPLDTPSGMYFVKIVKGNEVLVKKIFLYR